MKIVSFIFFLKDLELEMTKVVEKCNKDTKILKEKLTKKEQECEAVNEEKKETEKSEIHTKEMMRNLM
jgi:hypothetical protein